MSKPKSIIDIEILNEEIDFMELTVAPAVTEILENNMLTSQVGVLSVPPEKINLDNITNCPRCSKPLVKAKAIDGTESTSFLECPECGTLLNTYHPTLYQNVFLRRPERYKLGAGGYGSGKSRTSIEDVIKHILLVPNARIAVTARTYPSLEATFVKDFYAIFPVKLVRSKNEQKHEIKFTNGSEIIFRSFDDETKLKSMNLTMAVMVEASDIQYGGFTMLQSRIRNTAAMIPYFNSDGTPSMYWDDRQNVYRIKYQHDVRHITLETNPDSGWVKDKFLLDAKTVDFFGDAYNEGYKYKKDRDPHKYVQVVSTSANPYLPETYEEEQTRGKSKAYIAQFYKGSFNFSSNLVFPNVGITIVSPHKLPREFNDEGRRVLYFMISLDYGINDPTHIIYSAFSTETKKMYVYDELRMNNSDVKTIAEAHRKQVRMNGTNLRGLLMMPRFDGRSYNKRESDLISIGGMFEAEGLYFEPSFATHEARIIKVNALINHDQLEIFSTCENLIEEMLNYKFKVEKNGKVTNKPVDKNDHGITALEFTVVELPHNLKELKLGVYIPAGTEIIHDKQRKILKENKVEVFNPLSEVRNERSTAGYTNNLEFSNGISPDRTFYLLGSEEEEDNTDGGYGDTRPLNSYIPGHHR